MQAPELRETCRRQGDIVVSGWVWRGKLLVYDGTGVYLKPGNAGRNSSSTRGTSKKNCICTAVLQVWLAQPAKGSMLFTNAKLAHRRRGQLPGLKGSTSANARLRAKLKLKVSHVHFQTCQY